MNGGVEALAVAFAVSSQGAALFWRKREESCWGYGGQGCAESVEEVTTAPDV